MSAAWSIRTLTGLINVWWFTFHSLISLSELFCPLTSAPWPTSLARARSLSLTSTVSLKKDYFLLNFFFALSTSLHLLMQTYIFIRTAWWGTAILHGHPLKDINLFVLHWVFFCNQLYQMWAPTFFCVIFWICSICYGISINYNVV